MDTTPPPPKRKRLTTLPIRRTKPQSQPTPWQEIASGRKTLPPLHFAFEAIGNEVGTSGNSSSFPKNIIYWEDEKPVIDTLMVDKVKTPRDLYIKAKEDIISRYRSYGVKGTILETQEKKLHSKKFNRDTVFLYYCMNLICETGKPMGEFNILHKDLFPKTPDHIFCKDIRGIERNNPHHYHSETLDEKLPKSSPNLNQPGEYIKNMRAAFSDTDGIDFDEFISSRKFFEPQKISSSVDMLQHFFHSAKNWTVNTVKFIGLVHTNGEEVEFTGLNNTITFEEAKHNIMCSSIGYGYLLPPAYRKKFEWKNSELKIEKTHPHRKFVDNFGSELLPRLQDNISSKCNDLMQKFDNSPVLITTTYCKNQSISAYISKANRKTNSKVAELKSICERLESKTVIKELFTNNNFVTLYRVKKVDSNHITIEKETLEEPAKKRLGVKLDKMISLLAD